MHGLGNKFIVLYAGMMGYIPDIMTLLNVACELKDNKDIQFVFIGTGQREDEYKQFCKDNQLGNCHFLGVVPRNMIPLFCTSANVNINLFPKGDYGSIFLGNKTFDYMASGRPMIYVGDGGGTSTLLRESGGGIVVPAEDVCGIKLAIINLYNNPDLCLEMGEKGRQYIYNNYSASQLMPKIETLIQNVVNS